MPTDTRSNVRKIKEAIKSLLDELVTDGVINEAQSGDVRFFNAIDNKILAFPAAVLLPPAIDSKFEDQASNLRTYTFDVIIVEKQDNITEDGQIEDLSEAIFDKFDKNFSLGGVANGALDPVTSNPAPYNSNGKDYVVFTVTLKAKSLKQIIN